MNTAALVQRFSTGTYTVTRRARSTTSTRGVVDEGATTTLAIVGSASPAKGADLLKLPEGRSTDESRVVFTTTRLYVGEPSEAYEADRVTISGIVYELVHLERWVDPRGGDDTYKAIGVRA